MKIASLDEGPLAGWQLSGHSLCAMRYQNVAEPTATTIGAGLQTAKDFWLDVGGTCVNFIEGDLGFKVTGNRWLKTYGHTESVMLGNVFSTTIGLTETVKLSNDFALTVGIAESVTIAKKFTFNLSHEHKYSKSKTYAWAQDDVFNKVDKKWTDVKEISAEKVAKQKEEILNEVKTEIQTAQMTIKNETKEVTDKLEQKIANYKAEIDTYQQSITKLEATIKECKATINQLSCQLENFSLKADDEVEIKANKVVITADTSVTIKGGGKELSLSSSGSATNSTSIKVS